MLPAGLLKEIDRVAGPRKRGSFLADAAREKLAGCVFGFPLPEDGGDVPQGHVQGAKQADVLRFADLGLAVVAKARIRVHHGRFEQPDLVVVTQGLHRQAASLRKTADG